MRLGLFTVQKEKTGLLQKLRFPVVIKETFTADTSVLVAEYAFTAEELKKMPNWLRACLRWYGMRFMKKQKIHAAVMTIECAAAMRKGNADPKNQAGGMGRMSGRAVFRGAG